MDIHSPTFLPFPLELCTQLTRVSEGNTREMDVVFFPRDVPRIVVYDGVECCVLQLTGFLGAVVNVYRTEVEVSVLVEILRKAM